MFVSIIGTHPKCGENAIILTEIGAELPVGFEAKRVLAVAPSQIEAIMEGNAAASKLHRAVAVGATGAPAATTP
jgi:hypothetical protein